MTDHYEILGCDRKATQRELKEAYHKKALVTHPDKNEESHRRFLQVAEAWSVLKDAESRKAYDDQLKQKELYEGRTWDTYRLDQLCFEDQAQLYFVSCRCGGRYEVPKSEMKDLGSGSVVIECENCSLSVIFDLGE